jgi:hypothetical protein
MFLGKKKRVGFIKMVFSSAIYYLASPMSWLEIISEVDGYLPWSMIRQAGYSSCVVS